MDDLAHHADMLQHSLEDLSQHVQQLRGAWHDFKADARRRLRGSKAFRAGTRAADEFLAHWAWSERRSLLSWDARVPVPASWDSRHLVSLVEFARVLHEHLLDSAGSGLPPATVCFMLANLYIFVKPDGVLLRNVSLSPYCVVEKGQMSRLVTSAFVHVDATHLITNLTAALPDCLYLEEEEGSAAFLGELALLTLLSNGLYVALAGLMKSHFVKRHTYYSVMAVGCSGVVFALKVWAGYKRGGKAHVCGLPVPAQFAWVPALALTHICVPEASFPAHLCGVLAGVVRAYVVQPWLDVLQASLRRSAGVPWHQPPEQQRQHWSELQQRQRQQRPEQQQQQQQQRRQGSNSPSSSNGWSGAQLRDTKSAGRSGVHGSSDAAATAASAQAQAPHAHPHSAGWGSSRGTRLLLRDLGLHIGLATAATAIYLIATSKQPMQTLSSLWRR